MFMAARSLRIFFLVCILDACKVDTNLIRLTHRKIKLNHAIRLSNDKFNNIYINKKIYIILKNWWFLNYVIEDSLFFLSFSEIRFKNLSETLFFI